jgi:hypothetical protein
MCVKTEAAAFKGPDPEEATVPADQTFQKSRSEKVIKQKTEWEGPCGVCSGCRLLLGRDARPGSWHPSPLHRSSVLKNDMSPSQRHLLSKTREFHFRLPGLTINFTPVLSTWLSR